MFVYSTVVLYYNVGRSAGPDRMDSVISADSAGRKRWLAARGMHSLRDDADGSHISCA